MGNTTVMGSGDGTRPTTSGGTDNIGAASGVTGGTAGGQSSGPAPAEKLREKRKDAEAAKQDDSAAFGLRQDVTPEPNPEPPPQTKPQTQGD